MIERATRGVEPGSRGFRHAARGSRGGVERFRVRAVIAGLVVLGLLLLLGSRFYVLQVAQHAIYRTESEDNRVRIVPLPPPRGLIYDRNGVPLAENLPNYELTVVPEQAGPLPELLAELQQLVALREEDIKRFSRRIGQLRPFDSVLLRGQLTEEEVAAYSVNRHRFPGTEVQVRLTRHYPIGAFAAHVVGYVGRIDEQDLQRLDTADYAGTQHTGKTGIERSYEHLLHGKVGYQQVEVNASGRVLRVLASRPPVPGHSLTLNIDYRLQIIGAAALGELNGAVVAIEPATGAVLALVSKPGYDPNPFVNGIGTADYRALLHDKSRPLYNRALRGAYPPGSTVKPFLGLAGLALGAVSAKQPISCPGYFRLPGVKRPYRDWKRGGHGSMDVHSAIVESCDVYFYRLAQLLDVDRMHRFLAPFGFGARTGIDLAGEHPGLLPSRAWKRAAREEPWYPGETLIMGIGQGYFLTTPLQLAQATARLAMRGGGHVPQVLRSWQDEAGVQRTTIPAALPNIVVPDAAQWTRVQAAMADVVHGARGTARRIGQGAPYRMGGKTGTAQVFGLRPDQKYDPDKIPLELRDHALFIAYAPTEAPRIALAVFAEHGGGGGAVAAPIARLVLDQYLLYSDPS